MSPPRTCPTATRTRVLVVDDDPAFLDLLEVLLVEEGYDVHTVAAWQRAYPLARELQPDVIFLDLRMGGSENGWQVLDRLTLDAATRSIPVVLCSSEVTSLQARAPALLERHGVHVLAKPFDLDGVLETLGYIFRARPPHLHLVEEHRGAAPRQKQTQVDVLTPREWEVVALIARGLTNKQIAEHLVVTVGTVANHVHHALVKLGCTNRTQLAAWVAASQDRPTGERGPSRDERTPLYLPSVSRRTA